MKLIRFLAKDQMNAIDVCGSATVLLFLNDGAFVGAGAILVLTVILSATMKVIAREGDQS